MSVAKTGCRPPPGRSTSSLGSTCVDQQVLWVVDECVDQVGVGLCCLLLLMLSNVDGDSVGVQGPEPWWIGRVVKSFQSGKGVRSATLP